MAITKGIVSGGNYTFSAANQTITFSSDYLGMSLSDITYITNITSGVATVIYDPFDVAKGGVLNGLTLTLAYNTTLMSDSDPLQIIVGFTPSTATPQNVNVAPNSQLDAQTELLGSIADNIDMLVKAQDQSERMPINIRDENPAKRDDNNAQILSDAPSPINFSIRGHVLNDKVVIDTAGYRTLVIVLTIPSIWGASTIIEGSNDGNNNTFPTATGWSAVNNAVQSTPSNPGITIVSTVGATNYTPLQTITITVPCLYRYIRMRVSTASVTSSIPAVGTAFLRQTLYPLGPFSQLPVNANIGTIAGNTPSGFTTPPSNPLSPTSVGGAFNFTGSVIGTSNAPNAFSTLQTTFPYPVGIAGREQPYIGALSGIFRHITVDGGGRYILGGDTPDTETRFQSKRADGSISGIPPRGVGARPNTMYGSQALLVEDIAQSEGDTTTTLLQQILVELKMLNSQINELPLTINLGVKMQNEVQDYRQEEYNNHVNNQ